MRVNKLTVTMLYHFMKQDHFTKEGKGKVKLLSRKVACNLKEY
jgi:hypothetical protein